MAGNKLTLQKLRAKNFRSIGNAFMEIDYQASPTTLVASTDNGSGKSNLVIWALYFALYGKPYGKDCKIAGLVNNKSGKDCLVELEFETLGHTWLVRRGYKPGIFEIYQDGKLIESEAAKADQQTYLNSVVGMDEKAFTNIVALGIERFVPFVQMDTSQRRAFVEQMLDLIVVSQMNTIAKDKTKALRKELEQTNYELGILESKYSGRVRTLNILEEKKSQRLNETGAELDTFKKEEEKLNEMFNRASEKIADISSKLDHTVATRLEKTKDLIRRFESKLSDIDRNAKNVENLHDCPTCKQGVTDEHKSVIRGDAEAEATKLRAPLEKLQDELKTIQLLTLEQDAIKSDVNRVDGIQKQIVGKLQVVKSNIKSIESKLVNTNEDELIENEKLEMVKISADQKTTSNKIQELSDAETYHLQLLQVLKDEGIKASIVAQYVPFLNQTVNKILDQMNLYVQINIDSEFNVTMFAPDRKGQTLGNLSTGQLRRIDIAVLLAWREIAKNKASADCNVLILDEILENLSESGVDEFMDMWETIGTHTNLIVISQRPAEFDHHFDRTIKYALKNDLTVEV